MSRRPNLAVVARRSEPPDSLDYFPTPPWATRAFGWEMSQRGLLSRQHTILEPACGEGHMAAVLQEFIDPTIYASDIFPYGYGEVADFLDGGEKPAVDWIFSNPPFNQALAFVETALTHPAARARVGVGMLVRTAWLEGGEVSGRYEFFRRFRPALILQYAGRVPMHKGRWEPKGRSATAYCWVIWLQPDRPLGAWRPTLQSGPLFDWIAPDIRRTYARPDDVRRFALPAGAPLFDDSEVPYA
ncbi:hypothetical protein BA190_26790 [Labrys sp. WJW]|uniref:hypothetical protein n=1 Tax=Labrys sp. WJW TaxID=1737983 RepID=UPI000832CBC3|nr:hypothetical protein [Labrys sp. WJW]OCC01822.1 hypothetical protein BA190_26790 [Labrys sp. WJW]